MQKRRHKIDGILGRVERQEEPRPAGLGVSEMGLMSLFGMETGEQFAPDGSLL